MSCQTLLCLPSTSPQTTLARQGTLVDYELGGIALNDPSQGLMVQNWRARYVPPDIKVGPFPYSAESTVISPSGVVTELSLAFDQNMHANVAYVMNGTAYLYYYDSVDEDHRTIELADGAESPFLCLDDKRPFSTTTNANDVLALYIVGNKLRYRQQRERFGVERELYTLPSGQFRVKRFGMHQALRVQIELESRL